METDVQKRWTPHHVQDTASCGARCSNAHILNLLPCWRVKSHVSAWHPQPLYMCIYLETAICFIYFPLAQTVICLVYPVELITV